jgi:hypothetical protein
MEPSHLESLLTRGARDELRAVLRISARRASEMMAHIKAEQDVDYIIVQPLQPHLP